MGRQYFIGAGDGVTYREFQTDGDKVHSRLGTTNRKQVLERNRELKRNQGAVRTMDWGKLALDIPLPDLQMLNRWFPGIAEPGHPDHKFQMRRFLKSPASDPYRVTERIRK